MAAAAAAAGAKAAGRHIPPGASGKPTIPAGPRPAGRRLMAAVGRSGGATPPPREARPSGRRARTGQWCCLASPPPRAGPAAKRSRRGARQPRTPAARAGIAAVAAAGALIAGARRHRGRQRRGGGASRLARTLLLWRRHASGPVTSQAELAGPGLRRAAHRALASGGRRLRSGSNAAAWIVCRLEQACFDKGIPADHTATSLLGAVQQLSAASLLESLQTGEADRSESVTAVTAVGASQRGGVVVRSPLCFGSDPASQSSPSLD
jgi:hypothetical protein